MNIKIFNNKLSWLVGMICLCGQEDTDPKVGSSSSSSGE